MTNAIVDTKTRIFLAGVESVVERCKRFPPQQRESDTAKSFGNRINRHKFALSIGNGLLAVAEHEALPTVAKVGTAQVASNATTQFERINEQNTHLVNMMMFLQDVMKASTRQCLFWESVAKNRRSRPADEFKGGVDNVVDIEKNDDSLYDGPVEVISHNQALKFIEATQVAEGAELPELLEGLEELYNDLMVFTAHLQQHIRDWNNPPSQMLAYFSHARETDEGQVWEDCYDLASARLAYEEGQARAVEAQERRHSASLNTLSSFFG